MKSSHNSRDHLDERGIIFLWGTITDEAAESVCSRIIEANINSRLPHIQLLINSAGGSCHAGFAIIDMMNWSKLPVHTAGFGMVGSMAALIFAAGTPRHRALTPTTALLVHHFHSLSAGNYPNLISTRKYEDFLHERTVTHLMNHSNLTSRNDILKHLLRDTDTWLTPDDAIRYGLADTIQTRLNHPETDTTHRSLTP